MLTVSSGVLDFRGILFQGLLEDAIGLGGSLTHGCGNHLIMLFNLHSFCVNCSDI